MSYEVNFFYCVCLCTCVYVQVRNKIKQVHSSDEVLCPTLCNPMDCSPPGSSVHGDSPGQNTGMVCHVLLQGIFLTQGLNPGLLHFRQILYQMSYQRIPYGSVVLSIFMLCNQSPEVFILKDWTSDPTKKLHFLLSPASGKLQSSPCLYKFN